MSLIPCPGCSLPRTANDADFECPICGYLPDADEDADTDAPEPLRVVEVDDAPVSLAPVTPLPVRAGRSPVLPWVLAGLGFLGTAVCAVGWYFAVPDTPPLPATALTSATFREVAPRPRRVPDPLEVAPAPRLYSEPFEVIRVDARNDSYKLPAVEGKRRVKLVGVANKLFLASVSEGSEVDASELETRWVNVTGRIDDGATVRLVSPGGTVNFADGISGGATLSVEAAGGTVTFAKRTKSKRLLMPSNIEGGARVTLHGRQVSFLSPITGDGTTVDVTLGSRGHLKFVELDGGAKLHYRQAPNTADVPLIVNPGKVLGESEFKQVK